MELVVEQVAWPFQLWGEELQTLCASPEGLRQLALRQADVVGHNIIECTLVAYRGCIH